MFHLTQACYFSFYPYLFPLDRGTSLEGFRILVPCQTGSMFPEAVFGVWLQPAPADHVACF